MFEELKILEKTLKVQQSQTDNWRVGPNFFTQIPGGLKPGVVNLSPAWFEQGHQVGKKNSLLQIIFYDAIQGKDDLLRVSSDLLKHTGTIEWLGKSKEAFLLVGGILSIIQPELYKLGIQALERLHDNPTLCKQPAELARILQHWYSPFSAISVISNRSTPLHRDTGGRPQWLDLLIAVGEYEHGRFELPGIGLNLKYDPGTAVAFSGKIFRHGARCEGDRACIAFYMRDNVLDRLELPVGGWLHNSQYGEPSQHV